MPDSVMLEVARQVPYAIVLFSLIVIFLRYLEKQDDKRMLHDREMEALRINAAKERESERRVYDGQVNAMWASSIKEIISKQDATTETLAEQLKETARAFSGSLDAHERKSEERYKAMNITQNLLEVAKDQLKKR